MNPMRRQFAARLALQVRGEKSNRALPRVASVRSPMHIVAAARLGAHICTCPAAVIEQCFKHPLTDIGLEKFLKDWEKAQAAKV